MDSVPGQLSLFGDGAKEHEADLNAKAIASGRVKEMVKEITAPTEQDRQLKRVKGGLAAAIMAYRLNHNVGDEFSMDDLNEQLQLAGHAFRPDSPRRILRELQNDGVLEYRLVSRSKGIRRWTK